MKEKYINARDEENMGNDYDQRVGIDQPIRYQKGTRRLEKIPYGVDEDGNIVTMDLNIRISQHLFVDRRERENRTYYMYYLQV